MPASSPSVLTENLQGRALRFMRALAVAAACIAASSVQAQIHRVPISGGADATTLQHIADGLSTLLSRALEGVQVPYTASAGSKENLRRLAGDQPGFAIVYAGDLFRAAGGAPEAPAALAVTHLFGVTGHLLTRHDPPISQVADLAGKTISIGPAGSASANAARHYFETVNLWGRFEAMFLPASQGATALLEGRVDALWLFEEMPSVTVVQLADEAPLRILPLLDAAKLESLSNAHPYYTPTTIPEGMYVGVDNPVPSFQETALWVASADVPADIVTDALQTLYSEQGLSFMHTVSESARELHRDNGLRGVVTQLHPGAERFWHGADATAGEN
ncbi:MAG TPA: TAXI family TRAP transporter solute-binding subunit [Azoarcus taiwanensis]|nr:TAXI family TRAP transporter solute-binding subunit [Azoarcus taiwanensis]